MTNRSRGLIALAIALLCGTVPAFAGITPAVPEPTTILLMGGGLGAILVVRHLRARKK